MDVKSKIITQFIRDLSFENPNGPGSFQAGSERPAINANIDVKAQNRKVPMSMRWSFKLMLGPNGVTIICI